MSLDVMPYAVDPEAADRSLGHQLVFVGGQCS